MSEVTPSDGIHPKSTQNHFSRLFLHQGSIRRAIFATTCSYIREKNHSHVPTVPNRSTNCPTWSSTYTRTQTDSHTGAGSARCPWGDGASWNITFSPTTLWNGWRRCSSTSIRWRCREWVAFYDGRDKINFMRPEKCWGNCFISIFSHLSFSQVSWRVKNFSKEVMLYIIEKEI